MSTQEIYFVHGAEGELRVFPEENDDFEVLCIGRHMRFANDSQDELLRCLENTLELREYVDPRHVTVVRINGEDFMFVHFKTPEQDIRVRVPLPRELAVKLQAKTEKDMPDSHNDITSEEYNSAPAKMNRAITKCDFVRDFNSDDVAGWELCKDNTVEYKSSPLPDPPFPDDDEKEEAAAPAAGAAEPEVASSSGATADAGDDEREEQAENADPTVYIMPDKTTRIVAVRAGRHIYELLRDNIASALGTPIHCTLDEYFEMRGKGKRKTDEKLSYLNPTLLIGKDRSDRDCSMPYVHYHITDDNGKYNDPKYVILHNMTKSHLDGADGQMAAMRKECSLLGKNPDDYAVLRWTAADIHEGSQIVVTKSKMKTIPGNLLPAPENKKAAAGSAAPVAAIVPAGKRTAEEAGVTKHVVHKLPTLERGGACTFVVPANHSFKKQKENTASGKTYFTLYNEEEDEEED